MEIDTANICMVGSRGGEVIILNPQMQLTKEQALVHAAYLVLIAGDYNAEEFMKVFAAVSNA